MNREIKFRMWNNVESNKAMSKMFYSIDEVMECLKQQILFDNKGKLGYDHVSDGNAFMQYAGLKDKNGKEIYEGDIITDSGRDNEGNLNVCEWLNDDAKFVFVSPFDGKILKENSFATDETILGNLYENPELLK